MLVVYPYLLYPVMSNFVAVPTGTLRTFQDILQRVDLAAKHMAPQYHADKNVDLGRITTTRLHG